jgi:light-harvesting protein B-800-850 alpha chain
MNQGKIWLVVKPTVGLPAFLGGVAIISLAVHAAVLTNSDWYPAFYNGNLKAKAAAQANAAPPAVVAAAPAASANPSAPEAKSGKK